MNILWSTVLFPATRTPSGDPGPRNSVVLLFVLSYDLHFQSPLNISDRYRLCCRLILFDLFLLNGSLVLLCLRSTLFPSSNPVPYSDRSPTSSRQTVSLFKIDDVEKNTRVEVTMFLCHWYPIKDCRCIKDF